MLSSVTINCQVTSFLIVSVSNINISSHKLKISFNKIIKNCHKCLKGHKSLGSLCTVVNSLIVCGAQPTKGQGHLLSDISSCLVRQVVGHASVASSSPSPRPISRFPDSEDSSFSKGRDLNSSVLQKYVHLTQIISTVGALSRPSNRDNRRPSIHL